MVVGSAATSVQGSSQTEHTCCPTSKTHKASPLQAPGICPGCHIHFCIKLMSSMQSVFCCITCSVKPAQTCSACTHQCNHLLNIYALMAGFYRAANGSGGGIYLAANGATLSNITNTEFNSNTAGADGGGLNVTGGATVLTRNIFVANSAAGRGGAVAYTKQCFASGKKGFWCCPAPHLRLCHIMQQDLALTGAACKA